MRGWRCCDGVADEISELATFVMSSCLGRLGAGRATCEALLWLALGPNLVISLCQNSKLRPLAHQTQSGLGNASITQEKLRVPRGRNILSYPRQADLAASVNNNTQSILEVTINLRYNLLQTSRPITPFLLPSTLSPWPLLPSPAGAMPPSE